MRGIGPCQRIYGLWVRERAKNSEFHDEGFHISAKEVS